LIQHLVFYCIEATLITSMAWLGLFIAVNGMQRAGIAIHPRWTVAIAGLWIAVACTDALMSEMIGPEFTFHYYFGIWTMIGGAALWLALWIRQGTSLLLARAAVESRPRKEK
jgi:hypothetical protein